jgi:PAS domain S-box-containing protein
MEKIKEGSLSDQPLPTPNPSFPGDHLDILAELLGAAVTRENEDPLEAFQRITEIGARLLKTQRASIWFYNDTYSEIICQDLYERNADRHSRGERLAASVFPSYAAYHLLGRVIAADDVRTDPRTREIPASYYNDAGISSLLDAPVWVRDRLSALLSFEHVGPGRSWNRDDEQIAQILAAYTANLMEAAERRRAEKDREQFLAALRKSETLYRSIFESSPDAISISRASDDLYLDINEGFTRITGYSRDEVVGRTSRELQIWVNPGDRKQLAAALKERGEATNMEFPFRIKSGEIVWGLLSSALVAIGDELHIQSVIRDITTLKAAQADGRPSTGSAWPWRGVCSGPKSWSPSGPWREALPTISTTS